VLTNEACENIIQIKGNVRGAVLQTDAEYIKRYCGQEQFTNLKDTLQRLGYAVDYENISAMEWYPLGRRVLSFRVMQDLFNWQEEEFRKMGNAAPKYSFIVKLLMKFFISPKTGLSNASQY
jgi:hypothetical protein